MSTVISVPVSRLFAMATNGDVDAISRADVIRLAADVPVRDLNALIRDLNRYGSDLKRQAYDAFTVIGYLSDEIRRRAEKLEAGQLPEKS